MNTKFFLATTLAAVFSSAANADPFFAQMVLQDVTFQVESPNEGSINKVVVRASVAEASIGQVEEEADGTVTSVGIEDLDEQRAATLIMTARAPWFEALEQGGDAR